ncbi:MAG: hypothetical protein K8953_04610 [Proteobacteria bacterium]|nr:hypothetical protein [Pseudomonadota bacterium]
MTMFNGYIMTNWSGASSRVYRTSSIFVVSLIDGKKETESFSTRTRAHDYITCIMDKAGKNKKRLLLCFDFPFGYPANSYDGFRCNNWEELWDLISKEIDDKPDNRNNTFEVAGELNKTFTGVGPFWRHPSPNDNRFENLPYYQPDGYGDWLPSEFRHVEKLAKDPPRINPMSVWELYNPGSVGSKTLMGIPTLQKLKERGDCCVWPFQDLDENKHVIAEIYPAIWDKKNQPAMTIKERLCRTLKIISCLDKNERLQDFLNAPDAYDKNIIKKEGWILGVDENGNPAQCP